MASDGVRLMAFLYARSRYRMALDAGKAPEVANLEFAEHFLGPKERETSREAKVAVAALLGAMRLEKWRNGDE